MQYRGSCHCGAVVIFCGTCGNKVFYVPRSNADGFDVNVRCLDPPPREVIVRPFDGQRWEATAAFLAGNARRVFRLDAAT